MERLITELPPGHIFVFGSNTAGIHGAGAARTAVEKFGAMFGHGIGLQGRSYAIPTKDENLCTLPLDEIKEEVDRFIHFATQQSTMTFHVTKIGCGLAGYHEDDIRPMFKDAPANCILPEGWR